MRRAQKQIINKNNDDNNNNNNNRYVRIAIYWYTYGVQTRNLSSTHTFFLIMQPLYLLMYSTTGVVSVKNVSFVRFYNKKVLICVAAPTAGVSVADLWIFLFHLRGTLLNKPSWLYSVDQTSSSSSLFAEADFNTNKDIGA